VRLPLVGDDFSPDRDLSEEFIAATHGLGEIAGLERPADSPLAVVKVQGVVNPPRAVIAPEMVEAVFVINAKRRESKRHGEFLSLVAPRKGPRGHGGGSSRGKKRASKASPASQ